jgi:ABC-type transport system involved in cytochrome bd biosynthesis fused ATPase/permease subunit
MWTLPRDSVTPLPPLRALPPFAFLFVLRELGPFRAPFLWLTLCSIVSTTLGYASVLVIGDVISHIADRSVDDIVGRALPAYALLVLGTQLLDALTRRYAEGMPAAYGGWFAQRVLRTLLEVEHRQMANLSRERIGTLLSTWQTHLEAFLSQWFWLTSRRLVELAFILVTLWQQDPRVFVGGVVAVALFLVLSLALSARMSPLAREQTTLTVASRSTEQNLLQQLPLLQRLGVERFALDVIGRLFADRMQSMARLRAFHARRWLAQLLVFYAMYGGAMFFCIVQIKTGVVGVGFIVVLRYAFDRLFLFLVFFIEHYVELVQQREDAALIRRELGGLQRHPLSDALPPQWERLELLDARISFRPRGLSEEVTVTVPHLSLARGEHLGILGRSGSGKTTILLQLLGLLPTRGALRVDGTPVDALPARATAYVNSSDPLLKLSLRDNILLGRKVSDERLTTVLRGVCADEWVGDLDQRVGAADFHLSAGQEQRLRLARGLVDEEVELYLLDEPFSGLDGPTRDRVLAFLRAFLRDKTVVLVTHHVDELGLVDHVQELQDGVLSPRRPAHRATP